MRYVLSLIVVTVTVAVVNSPIAHAEQSADVEAVRQANETYLETVGARDLSGWRQDDYVRAIHPFRPIDVGWDAVRDGLIALFELFPEMFSGMPTPLVHVVGNIAWVTSEEAFRGVKPSGEVVEGTLRTTRIFDKTDSGWMLVLHQV